MAGLSVLGAILAAARDARRQVFGEFIIRIVYAQAAQKIWGSCITTWSETPQGTALKDESVEAAVSDAPYGRSALIQAGSRDELLTGSLAKLRRVLLPGRRTVFVDDRPVGGAIEEAGFEILEAHQERVHRSLTRHIYIFVCR